MREQLTQLQTAASRSIAETSSIAELESVSVEFLGRKSQLTAILRQLKDQPEAERKSLGQLANQVRLELGRLIEARRAELLGAQEAMVQLDPTLPGTRPKIGYPHPISLFLNKVTDTFVSMGFDVVGGPELEIAKYNFDLLNIPPKHPARDMWDTFYVQSPTRETADQADPNQRVLRTHTSPMQIREMEKRRPPVRLIVPGRVFRHEATDASHEAVFYQCEALVIDRDISIANLKHTIETFLRSLFGQTVEIRLRPEYYPFVEPGLDVEMSCLFCSGQGCPVCKQSGWIELIGSGMVHPKVLRNMGVNPAEYSGFAFGMGVDRLMMLYYGVNDVRLSYAGDLRFLSQFA